jgi:hypothetical protein
VLSEFASKGAFAGIGLGKGTAGIILPFLGPVGADLGATFDAAKAIGAAAKGAAGSEGFVVTLASLGAIFDAVGGVGALTSVVTGTWVVGFVAALGSAGFSADSSPGACCFAPTPIGAGFCCCGKCWPGGPGGYPP